MASRTYEIAYRLAAKLDNKFNQAFSKAESVASKSMKAIKNTVTTAIAGIGVTAMIASSTNAFMDFENSMNEVFTLLPGISSTAMEEMSDQVKKASIDMGVLPEETVPALYQALSAGVPKDNVFSFLEIANMAAVGGVSTLETAVDGLTTVTNSYGSDVIDATKASDLMFTAVKEGKTTFEELSGSLYDVLPSASASGVAFQDITAALAAMTSQGIPTSVATTKLRGVIDELSDTGSSVGKTFEQVSGKSFKAFIAGGGNMQEALQLLEKYAGSTNVGINELFSSTEAGSAALALTGNGTEKFTKSLEAMGNSAGATEEAFNTMQNGLARAVDVIKAKMKVFQLAIGELGGKALFGVIAVFDKVGSTITKVLEDNGLQVALLKTDFANLKTELSKLGELITGDVGTGFEGIAQVVIPKVINVLSFLIEKASVVVKFFETNWDSISTTVSEVGGTIGGFVGSVVNLADTIFDSLIPAFEGAGTSVFEYIPSAVDILQNLIEVATNVVDFISTNWGIIGPIVAGVVGAFLAFKTIITVVSTFVKVIKTVKTVMTIASSAIGFLTSPIGLVILAIGALITVGILLYKNWDTIKAKAQELWDKLGAFITDISERFPIVGAVIEVVAGYIGEQIENVKRIFGGIIDFVAGVFTGDWSRAWDGIVNIFGGIFNGIVSMAKYPIEMIYTIISAAITRISEKFPVIGQIIEQVKGYISVQIENIKQIFSGIIDFIAGVFTGDWSRAWEGIVSVFGGIFSGIGEMVKAPLNVVITLVNSIIDNINAMDIQIPDWVPKIGGQSFSLDIQKIPAFAKGTNNSPDTFIAGEAGAELVTNREHSKIFTALETGSIFRNLARLENLWNKLNSLGERKPDPNGNGGGTGGGFGGGGFDLGQLKPRNEGGGGPNLQITYSPNIKVEGGGNNEEILSAISSMLAKDKVELEKLVKKIMSDERSKKARLLNG